MQLTPTSELEAVNLMLSVIGESPVNSLTDIGVADAATAYKILSYSSREVQLVGWHWNTEENFPISPNSDGFLMLPPNTLKVDTSGLSCHLDLVQRGQRLYDRYNHTYEFTDPVRVEIVLMLDFDELPEAARSYITIRAARQFQERVLGSATLQAFTAQDEFRAFAFLRQAETETGDYNMLSGSWSVARILHRNTPDGIGLPNAT